MGRQKQQDGLLGQALGREGLPPQPSLGAPPHNREKAESLKAKPLGGVCKWRSCLSPKLESEQFSFVTLNCIPPSCPKSITPGSREGDTIWKTGSLQM